MSYFSTPRKAAMTPLLVVEHSNPVEWVWVIVPALLLAGLLVALLRSGDPGTERGVLRAPLARLADSLRRVTGLPAWCAGGLLLSLWSLTVAVVGFLWDVAWHIDFGRDTQLFTVPHTLILVGLLGLGLSALLSIGLATLEGADTAWHLGRLRIPRGALALGVLSAGAAVGFPLDDIWHANYGVDVTMWGPTHLLMIGGASLSPLAQLLLLTEAGGLKAGRPWLRLHLHSALIAAVVIGLSTFQLEYDDGVPQWQALYQPVLIMLATSIALVAARLAFGRGWGLITAVRFVVARGALALVVGPGLGHVTPRFPLYLGIGLAVEGGAWLARRRGPVAMALSCGAAAGTVGLASEWGFSHLWGRHPWQLSLVPDLWVALMVALAGAVVGVALGRIVAGQRANVPRVLLGAAFVALVAGLAIPLPRSTTPVTAVMRATPAGPATPATNRDGLPAPLQDYNLDLTLSPADAAQGADWFEALSWQGGSARNTPLVEVRPGEYRTAQPVPSGSSWKTLVWMAKHDVMMSLPVSFPLDLEYGQAPITPRPVQTLPFVASSSLLLRESHGGAAWPQILAYSGLGSITLLWIGVLVAGFASVDRGAGGPRPRPVRLRGRRQRGAAQRAPMRAG
jgi:hypothetical protein